MTIFIIIFGTLTLLAGIVIIINPQVIFGYLRNNLDKLALHILAVVVRLILGALLIYLSNESKFPIIIEILGWLSIVAALFFTVIGRKSFIRIISWALSLAKPFARVSGFVAVCVGAFLVYSFV